MRSKHLLVALVGVLTLGVALTAWASPAADSTLNVTFKPGTKKGGSAKKPQAQTLRIVFRGGTTTGMGQPETATSLNTVLPKQWRINSERWPRSKRCDIAKANQMKSAKVCPKGSKVGFGRSQAKASDGGLTQNLDVQAFVIKNGDIGFYLNDLPPRVSDVDQMIPGQTFGGNKLNVKIPTNLQSIAGLDVGITLLTTTFNGRVRVKGKTIGVIESRGCPRRGPWRFTETFVYKNRPGQSGATGKDSDTAPCVKPKRR